MDEKIGGIVEISTLSLKLPVSRDVTGLLDRWGGGDPCALGELVPAVYRELHRLARQAIRGERRDHTLQATALVHEAYLRLARSRPPACKSRVHFFSLVARLMRRILVDHARSVRAVRRGGAAVRVSLEEVEVPGAETPVPDLVALDEALDALAALDPRKARVVELRYFGGLTVAETSEVLGVAPPTVVLDTRLARAWLYDRMADGSAHAG